MFTFIGFWNSSSSLVRSINSMQVLFGNWALAVFDCVFVCCECEGLEFPEFPIDLSFGAKNKNQTLLISWTGNFFFWKSYKNLLILPFCCVFEQLAIIGAGSLPFDWVMAAFEAFSPIIKFEITNFKNMHRNIIILYAKSRSSYKDFI